MGLSLRTERLLLRPLTDRDARPLADRIFGDPENGWRYGVVADTSTPEKLRDTARDWIEDANAHWALGWGAWAVCGTEDGFAEDGELLGFCGFFSADEPVPDHELAYGVARAHWNKGVATEAVRASLSYIFADVGVPRVETVAHPTINLGSSRVLEKAGMELIGQIDYLGSVAAGHGLFNHFGIDRDTWLARNPELAFAFV